MEERAASETPVEVLERLLSGHWVAQAIAAVAELGVADSLADGPKTAEEVGRAVGAHAGALHRVLRALASVGVFTEVEPERFGLTAIGGYLRADVVGSLRGLARLANHLDWAAWGGMPYSLKTGEPAFQHVHGVDPFGYFQRQPEAGRVFDEAMAGHVTAHGMAVVAAYDFAPFARIVDVGGGYGTLMTAILRANPGTRGTIVDLARVIVGARRTIAAAGLAARCDCVVGDFFASLPPDGDAYVLGSILHEWDDARSLTILRTCRRVMADHARLLLVEMVIPDGHVPLRAEWVDLEMLVCFGGRERTEAEYGALLAAAGFRVTRVVASHSPASVIEAVPSY